MFINGEWINKIWYTWISFSLKKKNELTHATKHVRHYAKWSKPDTKGQILYDSHLGGI